MIREQTIESYLVSMVEAAGGIAEKTVSPGSRGYFDRVIVLPAGNVIFAEVKKPRGSHTSVHQRKRHAQYEALGATVWVVKTKADVDRLLAEAMRL
jgi:hypothetical protein